MKKIWMSLLALTLVLGLIGCGSQTAQSEARSPAAEKPAENSAQEEANGAKDKPQTGTIAWHYVLTTDKRVEEKKNAEGVLLAETSYELPKLEAICDGGDTSLTPPEAQRKVCEVFNSRVAELSKSLTTVEKLAESAQEQYNELKNSDIDYGGLMDSVLTRLLIWLIPCLAITGPFTAGLSYVTRNWARDEHAFIWSDFKDALKANWKQSLVVSVITSILPAAIYVGWRYYGQMAGNSVIMIVPQVLVVLVGIIWAISVTYMHPLIVTYELKQMDVFRNALLLGVARLPFSVGIRLLHCVPAIIWFIAIWFFNYFINNF